jgi:hypothetical protein
MDQMTELLPVLLPSAFNADQFATRLAEFVSDWKTTAPDLNIEASLDLVLYDICDYLAEAGFDGAHERILGRNLAAALHERANIPLDIKLSEEDIEEKEANYDRCI